MCRIWWHPSCLIILNGNCEKCQTLTRVLANCCDVPPETPQTFGLKSSNFHRHLTIWFVYSELQQKHGGAVWWSLWGGPLHLCLSRVHLIQSTFLLHCQQSPNMQNSSWKELLDCCYVIRVSSEPLGCLTLWRLAVLWLLLLDIVIVKVYSKHLSRAACRDFEKPRHANDINTTE